MNATIEDEEFIEQFVRESGVLLECQKLALEANLGRLAGENGLELLWLRHDHHPVVEMVLYVGNEDERRVSLRCRSMVSGFLQSAGAKVRRDKVFARYCRSVIRSAVALEW